MTYGLLTTPRAAYRRLRSTLAWRDVDALIASFPKSGRTWFRFIMANYLKMMITPDQPADLHNMFTVHPNLAWDRERGIPAFAFRQSGAMPLIAFTHDHPNWLFRSNRPVIFMLRDPRDVMVSAYFHAARHKHRFFGTIDDFVRDPVLGVGAMIRHLNAWSTILSHHPHYVLHYERLSASPETVTLEVLRFLRIHQDKALIGRAVEAASFSNMRKLEMDRGMPGHEYDRSDPQALRIRRGTVGGFAEELTGSTADWILDRYMVGLAPAVFDLPRLGLTTPKPGNSAFLRDLHRPQWVT